MKKHNIFLFLFFVLGFTIGSFYQNSKWAMKFAELRESLRFSVAAESPKSPISEGEDLAADEPFNSNKWEQVTDLLKYKSGAAFYQGLVATSLKPYLQKPELFQILRERFAKPYSADRYEHHNPEYHAEAAARIYLLQRLYKDQLQQEKKENKELMAFYRRVLNNPNEDWVIQRQAYKNISYWSVFMTEKERNDLIAKTDRRTLASLEMPDRELLQKMVNDEE